MHLKQKRYMEKDISMHLTILGSFMKFYTFLSIVEIWMFQEVNGNNLTCFIYSCVFRDELPKSTLS